MALGDITLSTQRREPLARGDDAVAMSAMICGLSWIQLRPTTAGAGVQFVTDESIEPGGEIASSQRTTVSAHLAVEAAKALPHVADELAKARHLLDRAQEQVGNDLGSDIGAFPATKPYAETFGPKSG